MFWRLNFLVFWLMMVHGNTYILYYICPLHTFFFLTVFFALRIMVRGDVLCVTCEVCVCVVCFMCISQCCACAVCVVYATMLYGIVPMSNAV